MLLPKFGSDLGQVRGPGRWGDAIPVKTSTSATPVLPSLLVPLSCCQAVEEVLETMEPVFEKHPEMVEVMERLVEPERMIAFRVAWVDDGSKQQARVGVRFSPWPTPRT